MKKWFWFGLIGLLLFEVANVYFIMPFPGSQQFNTVDLAYFLYHWRWAFRILLGLLIVAGLLKSNWRRKLVPATGVLVTSGALYILNFQMAADSIFKMPEQMVLATVKENKIDSTRLVIGIAINGQAKAYPIKILGYHHQVQDTLSGKPILVTYCTVCRTGRVYEPLVKGVHEQFRLVGMDHFNAMIEDLTTKSWWQQATGKAITGPLKGEQLPELHSVQTSLAQWIHLYPSTLILQEDPAFRDQYDSTGNYETGKSRKSLTGTDSLSWKEKSWVIGLKKDGHTAAVDWNELTQKRLIRGTLGNTPYMLLLGEDIRSFFAFEDPLPAEPALLDSDTLKLGQRHFRLDGKGLDTTLQLKPIRAYQEFWHSWRTFNPGTTKK